MNLTSIVLALSLLSEPEGSVSYVDLSTVGIKSYLKFV